MMAQVSVHNDDEIPVCMFNSVDVGRSETQFGRSRSQQDSVFSVYFLKLFGDIQSSIRATIVDDDYFVIDVPVGGSVENIRTWQLDGFYRENTYASCMYFTINQMMMGRFSLSLYVGSSMEYLLAVMVVGLYHDFFWRTSL